MTYTVSQAFTVVGAVEASYSQLWSLYYPLIQKNPALTSQKLQDLGTRLRRMSPTSMVRIGDDSIAGIVRYGFGTAKANIVMAKQMLASSSASLNMAKIANLIDTAKGADLGGDPARGTLVVDVNFAYNPSCAYDPAWACPLAPPGNVVDVAVPVGELMPSGGY